MILETGSTPQTREATIEAIVVEAFGGPDRLKLQERPDPRPAPGQVLIRTRLTSVNFADVLSRGGGYEGGSQPPFIPGLDCVGTILALGEGVSGLRVGQRVVAFPVGGSYASLTVASAVLTYPIPDALDDESVCGLTVLVTAYNVLTLAGRLQKGETVLVHAAAGGVGSTAVQLALALGAGRVIGTVSTDQKCALVARLGGLAINSSREEFSDRVLERTGGAGADLILDSISGVTLERGLSCLAPFGRLVVFGQASGQAAQVGTPMLHRHNRAVIGYSSGHYRKQRPAALQPAVSAAFGHLINRDIRLEIGARYALRDAARAQALVEERRSLGKVILEVQV